jgi:putative peptidoglycan lipid II flippase
MVRDMAFAYFLGASGLMDGWAIAFKIPNLARRLFGEGAASSSLIPVYSEQLHQDAGRAHRLAFTVATVVFVLLSLTTVLGEAFIWIYYHYSATESTKLKLALSGVMLPYMILICVVAILAGVLQTHRHFAAPAAAPIVLNAFIILALCLSGWVMNVSAKIQVFIVAGGVLLAGVAQLLLQLLPLRLRGIPFRPAWDVKSAAFRKVIWLMGPMVLGLTATQINTLADDFIALWLSGSPDKGGTFVVFGREIGYPLWVGAVSHLFYAQRLYQFPLGVFGISLATAIFPAMSADAGRRDYNALCRTISQGLRCAVFVALPATVGLFLVSRPLVAAIFQRGAFTAGDATITAVTLSFYLVGLTGYFAQQVLTRAFYSLQEPGVPARSAMIAVVVNIVLNLTLIWPLGTGGLAVATSLCSYVQVVFLASVVRRRFGRAIFTGLARAILLSLIATLIMALVVMLVSRWLAPYGRLVRLAVAVGIGGGVYVAAARLLRIEMLSLLIGREHSDSS